ncbi:MAG: ROK family glucokinase [Lachnospiraceae bacterium]
MVEYAIGVDIGGTTVKLGLFDMQGMLIDKWEIPTRTEDRGIHILPDIVESINCISKKKDIGWDSIKGIGIGVPGPVLNKSTVNKCANLGWDIVNVREIMQKLTGVSNIVVENDANVAALGELWKGDCGSCSNAVMITIGTGVGGGVILNGEIISGQFGAAGELGHLQINPAETQPCTCGKFGHLQQYASATGIVSVAVKKLAESNQSSELRKKESITAKDIFDAAKAGDKISVETVKSAANMIARTMAFISAIIDPELYLIGGGVSKAGDFLINEIRDQFRKNAFFASENARIEPAVLGNDAGIYGAVKMIL